MRPEFSQDTLTVLFTDLEGSTDLRNRIGDEAANHLIQMHERLIRAEVEASGGAEARYLGDGFMILFGSAGEAIRCAVQIQRAIDDHNRREPHEPIKVRMGLNTGDVSRQQGEVYGASVNAASRVCNKAQGGQILITQTVKDLAGKLPDVRIVDRGLTWLKGFPNRWRLYEVLWRDESMAAGSSMRASPPTGLGTETGLPRSQSAIVGRGAELEVIRHELEEAHRGSLRAVALEGEAGIGKTRMLEHACDLAAQAEPPFWVLRVAADEELRGPFFLFRTLFASQEIEDFAEEAAGTQPLAAARQAIAGRGDGGRESLSPQDQMLRVFDEAAGAIRSLARVRPVALLLDDLQWADVDSINLIRYLVRTAAATPIFILITLRPEADSPAAAPNNLVADLERMHIARRLSLRRFSRGETAELLGNVLEGGQVAPATLDSLHSRAEGVPFFIEEFARAYRETNALQLINGTWTLTRLTGPSVPVSVQSLIARRLAQLTPEVRSLLSDAAILGRRFRLGDLAAIVSSVEGTGLSELRLADTLHSAVWVGIISELAESSGYDYSFSHEQIQEALVQSQSRHRKRLIHSAIADLMASQPDDSNLAALAYHALAAGDEKRGVQWAARAARAGLESRAPEESLRIVEMALAAATSGPERIELLKIKDTDLELLDRAEDRLANLAQLGALAGAAGDEQAEMDVKLRRASALRMMREFEAAAEAASQVRQTAASLGNRRMELEACLEVGQALTQSPLGEAFWPLAEVDLEAAAEPFGRARQIAHEIADRSAEAAALRELGVLETGRVKNWILKGLGEGERPQDLIFRMSREGRLDKAKDLIGEALKLYEELGDRRGVTSSLISMAYTHVTDFTRRGEAGRIEQIRRLHSGRKRTVSESQRAVEDAQMLYSIHVFARAHVYPDLAIQRGRQAFEAARSIGDRWLEFLCAGGVATTHVSLLQLAEAEAWLQRAKALAPSLASPVLARRLETWMGVFYAADNDASRALEHLERAVAMAVELGSAAGRCEQLAVLALEAAKLAAPEGAETLLERAEAAAAGAREVARTLAGQLPWEAQAWAASSLVAQVEGDAQKAAQAARSSLGILEPRFKRELYLDVLWITARSLVRGEAPEGPDLAAEIRENLWMIENSTVDPEIKEAWFRVPMHAELAEMAGYERQSEQDASWPVHELAQPEVEILAMLSEGKSDNEIAEQLGVEKQSVEQEISELFSKLGVSSRTAAAQYAIRQGVA